MLLALGVSLSAGVGAVCRYALDRAVQHRTRSTFPYGTFVINVSGSFLLGLVLGLSAHHALPSATAALVGTGFAGGFTTLSTWAWETLALALSGARAGAVGNVVGSVAAGLAAAAAGLAIALL